MLKKQYKVLAGAIALAFAASTATAAVSQEEANKLGNSLTPIGAEMAGNGGAIPAWTGGLTTSPAGFKTGDKPVNPFPEDKVQFTITADNYKEYADNLTDGQKAMFEKYPDTYRMPVYQTRRTAAYPQYIYDETKNYTTHTKMGQDGNRLENLLKGEPLTETKNSLEDIWNHITRYRGGSVRHVVGQTTPQANVDYSIVRLREEFTFATNL